MLVTRENYIERIRPFYEVDLIKVLIGSRRSGKSKILELIMNELKEKGISDDKIIYLNFEDVVYDEITDYKTFNNYILSKVKEGRYYMFFDEVQNIKYFEKTINSLRATQNCSIFITGSNSKLLSGEIATLLTGRVIEFQINPYTYSEAIKYLNINNKVIPKNFIQNFLKLGGYPLRFDLDDETSIINYLNQLYDSIISKDIIKRNSELEINKFKKICSYMLVNAGNDFVPENIVNYLKSQNNGKEDVSIQSIYTYIEKMEKAFLIQPVKRYNISGKEILKSKPKYYAIDNGFRYINTNTSEFNIGFFVENLVYNELISRGYNVFIGKTYKGEIDFVVVKNTKKCFIQVAFMINSQETIDREFNAFKPISDSSPKYVISLDQFDYSKDGITHLNLIEFLEHQVDIVLT